MPPTRDDDPADETNDLDADPGPCWCGEPNPHYDDDTLDSTCGGTGEVHCYCGGDFCVCHNHGSVPCHGCEDCDEPDEDGFHDEYYLDDDTVKYDAEHP